MGVNHTSSMTICLYQRLDSRDHLGGGPPLSRAHRFYKVRSVENQLFSCVGVVVKEIEIYNMRPKKKKIEKSPDYMSVSFKLWQQK